MEANRTQAEIEPPAYFFAFANIKARSSTLARTWISFRFLEIFFTFFFAPTGTSILFLSSFGNTSFTISPWFPTLIPIVFLDLLQSFHHPDALPQVVRLQCFQDKFCRLLVTAGVDAITHTIFDDIQVRVIPNLRDQFFLERELRFHFDRTSPESFSKMIFCFSSASAIRFNCPATSFAILLSTSILLLSKLPGEERLR